MQSRAEQSRAQTPFANQFGNHAFEGVDHAFACGVCDFRDEVQINY